MRLVALFIILGIVPISQQHQPRSKRLVIGLDASLESQWLKTELERDWTKPSNAVDLDEQSKAQLRRYRDMAADIKTLQMTYTEDVPLGVKRPALKFGSSGWQTIDKRAFRENALPLESVYWYKQTHYEDELEERLKQEYAKRDLTAHLRNAIALRKIRRQLEDRTPGAVAIYLYKRLIAVQFWDIREGRWTTLLQQPQRMDYEAVQAALIKKVGKAYYEEHRFCDIKTHEVCQDVCAAYGDFYVIELGGLTTHQVPLPLTGIDCTTPPELPPFVFAISDPPFLRPGEKFDGRKRPWEEAPPPPEGGK
jgi:hypothetical protein